MQRLAGLGLTVLERGWLSSNNILIHPAAGEAGALLVDSGHVNHAEQTVALVRHALGAAPAAAGGGGGGGGGMPLAGLVNTHLHSDHCGGNAALAAAFGMPITIPPGQAEAVRAWNDDGLSYRATGQRIARFGCSRTLEPGEPLVAGGREWQVIAAPGHDPHSVMLFDATAGVLISADALWQDGFGVVFPEVVGEPGFDDVAAVLDAIAALPVKLVIPGHGAPFDDVPAALERARSRLAAFRTDPARHRRHAAKVLLKYHVMEEHEMPLAALRAWAAATPLLQSAWQQGPPAGIATPAQWIDTLLHELARAGALRIGNGRVFDA